MEEIRIDSVNAYNKLYGLKSSNPLIGVLDIGEAKNLVNNVKLKFELYALFLKNNAQCSLKYGRRSYDYQEGTIVSFAPGQLVEITDEKEVGPNVTGLLFHPDLLFGTPLATKIDSFDFFSYMPSESLHLSESEREKFNFFINLIREELDYPVDSHSSSVLSANIQLLLEHLDRFYDRQFITRHKVNSDVVARFREHLAQYFSDSNASAYPSVSYFADKAALSTGYFSDLVKKETGMSPKDMISLQLVTEAKRRLASTTDDIGVIAYSLGFDYPAHFTRMFKRLTGQTPTEFRINLN